MAYEGKPAKEFMDIPEVQQQLEAAAIVVGIEAQEGFQSLTDNCLRHVRSLRFDSPLEVMFWIWWQALEHGYLWMREDITLTAQHELEVDGERFRLDFYVNPAPLYERHLESFGLAWPKIAVEVDGHGFHERTKDQVALMDRRDRLLQQQQWRIFHFSWSEFTTNPKDCTREVWEFVAGAHYELQKTARQRPPLFI